MRNIPVIHGANPDNLYHAFGIPMPEKILDFSTNTNIISWPEVNINLERLASQYPDPECRRLREFISMRENVSPDKILFTNGINEAIFLLGKIFTGSTAILQPCYPEYSRAFVNLQDVFDLHEAGRFRQVILANPNNPTGSYIANLSDMIKTFPDTTFIIDEAYVNFLLHYEKRERLYEFGNVIILRSLTKIFHLSGVRAGYVVADENIISAMKNLQPTWSVNAIAQKLALKFLQDDNFYATTINFYRKNTPEFMNALRGAGFDVMESAVHYFLVRVNDDIELIKYLMRSGIVARHTRNFAGLDGKYIRVATRRSDENEFFVSVIKNFPLAIPKGVL